MLLGLKVMLVGFSSSNILPSADFKFLTDTMRFKNKVPEEREKSEV